jgi:hypothetical protein
MVAASVVQTLRLSTVGRSGSPTASEDALISTVRKRLGAPLKADGDAALRPQLIHGLEPLVTYLRVTLPENDFALLLAGGLDDAVFELFKLVSQRTRYMKKFASIIDSNTEWARVARGLRAVARGKALVPPTAIYQDKSRALAVWTPPSQKWFCMRSRRWTSCWIGLAGLVILFYLPY